MTFAGAAICANVDFRIGTDDRLYGPTATQIKTTWTYDADGNVLTENRWDSTAQLWRTTATSWSSTGKPLTITNPAGDLARTCYNALDQETIKVDPTGRATRTSYNAASQPTLIERWLTGDPSDATCNVTNTRPTEIATNRWRGFEYNVGGLQSAEIDGNGNRTTVTYDGLGRHMLTTYADGKFVQTLRNERDQVYTTFKRAGDMHQAYYDALGRVQRVWEHASAADNLPYPRGRHTRTSYDLAGRMMWNDVSMQTGGVYDATLERDIRTYQYDAAGRVVEDRIKASASATQQVLTYGYDSTGNRTSITWPDSYEAVYRFDAGNRADRVTFGPHTANITVDSLSRRTSLGRSNGTTTSYAYDDNGGLSQLAHAWASGSGQTAGTFGYGRDAAGRVINTTISRPDLEWMPTLEYARDYGVPTNLNQTTSMAGIELKWDPNGNLREHGNRRFVWTWGNRLAEVHSPGNDSVYAYDGQDRRTTVIDNGVLTRTLWSGADEVAEYGDQGQLVRRFIPDGTGAMDARLATVTPDGTAYWHHTDPQGSVIGTSGANGAPQDLTNYSPHGEFGNKPNGDPITLPPANSPFGYTGRQYDFATGLYQYRARYYDSELGIFLSMDPIGTKDDPNLYVYVGLDPVNATDPTGLARCGNCTETENQAYEAAEARAREKIRSARAALDRYIDAPESEDGKAFAVAFEKAFGVSAKEDGAIDQYSRQLNVIGGILSSDVPVILMGSSQETYGNAGTINLRTGMVTYDRSYFQSSSDSEFVTRLVIHEPMHTWRQQGYGSDRSAGGWRISDNPDGTPNLELAHRFSHERRTSSHRARHNPHSITYFITDAWGAW